MINMDELELQELLADYLASITVNEYGAKVIIVDDVNKISRQFIQEIKCSSEEKY